MGLDMDSFVISRPPVRSQPVVPVFLGKRRLAGAKETRNPDPYALVRRLRCGGHSGEQPLIFGQLGVDRFFIGVVDLDNFFDWLEESRSKRSAILIMILSPVNLDAVAV